MKVIFLDIDGVLNYTNWYISEKYQELQWNEDNEIDVDPLCSERINNICKKTGAKIVITSDWRISWYSTTMRLERGGINPEYIIDKTPEHLWNTPPMFDRSRGSEIEHWLMLHPNCDGYVIIDDRTDFKENQLNNFIHINPMYGISNDDMEKAIAILNKN